MTNETTQDMHEQRKKKLPNIHVLQEASRSSLIACDSGFHSFL